MTSQSCEFVVPGSDLYETCRSQSIQYCANDKNIPSAQCRKDAERYEEINILRKLWCQNPDNQSHEFYSAACPNGSEDVVDKTTYTYTAPTINSTSTTNVNAEASINAAIGESPDALDVTSTVSTPGGGTTTSTNISYEITPDPQTSNVVSSVSSWDMTWLLIIIVVVFASMIIGWKVWKAKSSTKKFNSSRR